MFLIPHLRGTGELYEAICDTCFWEMSISRARDTALVTPNIRGIDMPIQKPGSIKRGDRVKILHSSGLVGRVVELRGPLGPKGALIYRVLLRRKPKPAYIEVREDQLETIPPV
jgi:hypothetical protein